MLFPDSFIDELKQRLPISKVIGSKVKLKKYGSLLKGLCPFHQEKTPSFTVHDHKGIYYCFGCHASGDVIEFVSKTENNSFNDIVKQLALAAGLALPKLSPIEQKKEEQKIDLLAVIAKASEWFTKQLKLSSNYHALEYFTQRGINAQDIELFSLGYAPSKGLLAFLTRSGFNAALAMDAGLAIKTDSGEYIDRFRGRIMFPIKNIKGKIVGFGGRALSAEILPKYLNSSETSLFKKNNFLYLADIARPTAFKSERIIAVEGYLDAIFMHKADLNETVASLGTAFNERHLQNLWLLANEAILCFDGDIAGKKAMIKAAHSALALLEPGFTLKFCILPNNQDPDDIIKQYGKDYMQQLINNSSSLVDFIWQSELELSKPNTPEGRALFEHKIYHLISQIKNKIVAGHYRQFMKDKLWQEFAQKHRYKKNIISLQNHKLTIINHLSYQERLLYSLFASLLIYNDLIMDPEIFNELTRFEIDHQELESLRGIITQYHESTPEEQNNQETNLNSLIIKHNLSKLVELLSGKGSSFIDLLSTTNQEVVKNNWFLTYKKYTLELLKNEYTKLMKKAYQDNEAFIKADELKKSLDLLAQEIIAKEDNH